MLVFIFNVAVTPAVVKIAFVAVVVVTVHGVIIDGSVARHRTGKLGAIAETIQDALVVPALGPVSAQSSVAKTTLGAKNRRGSVSPSTVPCAVLQMRDPAQELGAAVMTQRQTWIHKHSQK